MAHSEVTIKVTPTELDFIKSALEFYRGIALATKSRHNIVAVEEVKEAIGSRIQKAVGPIHKDVRGAATMAESILMGLF